MHGAWVPVNGRSMNSGLSWRNGIQCMGASEWQSAEDCLHKPKFTCLLLSTSSGDHHLNIWLLPNCIQ